jgi:hypothetical protein
LEIVGQAGHLELISPRIPAGRDVVELTLSALIEEDSETDPGVASPCPTSRTGHEVDD